MITVDEFFAALDATGHPANPAQIGDTVRGSDHGDIGVIDAVVEPSEQTDGYLLVPRGLIFKTDTYIPLDAVVKRAGTDVFINIPKLFVTQMPWTEPPSRTERRQMQGRGASQIDKLYASRSPTAHVD